MNTFKLNSSRVLEHTKKENLYERENKITSFKFILPETIGNYNRADCEIELRCYIEGDDYIPYAVDTDNAETEVVITTDLTETAQIVPLMLYITHSGEVIGKTNEIPFVIHNSKADTPPLTPREEFDEVIREQRAEIAEQTETISEQASQIEQDEQTISGLNTQVSELTTENEQLETQHTADQNTIQYLIENPPEAHLQPKSVTPTAQMQVVEPDEGYQGLSIVTVGATTPPRLQSKQVSPSESTTYVTADGNYDGLSSVTVLGTSLINPELDVFFKREVPINLTFNQQIVFASICLGNEMIRIVNFLEKVKTIASTAFANCRGIVEVNFSEGLETLDNSAFVGCSNLVTVELPKGTKTLAADSLGNCANLKNVYLPNSLTSVHAYTFRNSIVLQNVTLQNGFNCSLNLSSSTLYSAETLVAMLEALADRTGLTAYTLIIGTPNINKLSTEQKAIATNKNWNLA